MADVVVPGEHPGRKDSGTSKHVCRWIWLGGEGPWTVCEGCGTIKDDRTGRILSD